MRLVSAIYHGSHPFDTYSVFNTFHTTSDPDSLQEGDVLVVWGGGDISPTLYKRKVGAAYASSVPSQRDMTEWNLMRRAKELKIPIIGVCRGGQMITALEGGHLIQHINNHGGYHNIETKDGQLLKVNSIHHQMMVPSKESDAEIIAVTSPSLSDIYLDVDENGTNINVIMDNEPEFIYYPSIKGFAIQWHPEGLSETNLSNKYLQKFIEERL